MTTFDGMLIAAAVFLMLVTYSSLNRWFVVVDSGGKKIRVFLLLNGVRSFIQAVRNRVPYDRYRGAEVGFRVLDSWGM